MLADFEGDLRRTGVNFPRFDGHQVKPEGRFGQEVSDESKAQGVFA